MTRETVNHFIQNHMTEDEKNALLANLLMYGNKDSVVGFKTKSTLMKVQHRMSELCKDDTNHFFDNPTEDNLEPLPITIVII